MKKLILFLLIAISIACNNQNATTADKATVNVDSGFTVTKTSKLLTATATKEYSHAKRKNTEFALDQESAKTVSKDFLIKISKDEVVISNPDNSVVHKFHINKTWVEKIGPDTMYNLTDANNAEYLLSHYYSTAYKADHFKLRYKKVLESYTNQED